MDKKDIDRIFGFSLKFCWGWDEQKIAPPLGHGNGLMVWPYSDSLHFMQDQCLRNDDGPVYNLAGALKGYHDTSASFLKRYDDRIKAHPIIQWAITSTNRFNLRYAQKEHDEKKLKQYIHDGWGLGFCKHGSTALMKITLSFVKQDPQIIGKWIRMYLRYYYHWHHRHYENTQVSEGTQNKQKGIRLKSYLRLMDWLLRIFSPFIRLLAGLLEPLSGAANPVMKFIFPIIAPVYLRLIKKWDAALEPLSKQLVQAVVTSDPSIFDV